MTCTALVLLLAAEVPPPAMDPALWKHLRAWEAVVAGTSSLISEGGTKAETDHTTGKTRTYGASVWYLKPNLIRLRLDLVPPPGQKPDPNAYTTYICNGRSLFEYDGGVRDATGKLTPTVTEYPLGGLVDPSSHILVEFMSGTISARRAAQRFAINWVKPEDPTYLILEFTPILPKDRSEFDLMTLVLIKPDLAPPLDDLAYLPRLAKIVRPGTKRLETWDFPNPKRNPVKKDGTPVGPGDFVPPPPGDGWKVVKPAVWAKVGKEDVK